MKYFFVLLIALSPLALAAQDIKAIHTSYYGADSPYFTVISDALGINDSVAVFTGYSKSNTGNMPSDPRYDTLPVVAYITAVNAKHQVLWTKYYGGNRATLAHRIIKTHDGGYMLFGSTRSSMCPEFPVPNNSANGGGDIFMLKLDKHFNRQWSNLYGGRSGETPISVTQCSNGDYIIVGNCNDTGRDIPIDYGFFQDWFMVRTDSLGNRKWSRTLGGTKDEYYDGNVLELNNKIYFVSTTESNDIDCTYPPNWPFTQRVNVRVFLLDSLGSLLNTLAFGGSEGSKVYGALINHKGELVVYGTTRSRDYDVTPDTPLTSTSVLKVWLLCIDSLGNKQWDLLIGGNNWEVPLVAGENKLKFIQDENKNYFGAWSSVEPKPPYIGPGGQDHWLALVDTNGKSITNKLFGSIYYDLFYTLAKAGEDFFVFGNVGSPVKEGSQEAKIGYYKRAFTNFQYWPLATIDRVRQPDQTITLSPNPADNSVAIVWGKQWAVSHIYLLSIEGTKVLSIVPEANRHSITLNTASLSSGVYTVVVQGKDQKQVAQKLVLQ